MAEELLFLVLLLVLVLASASSPVPTFSPNVSYLFSG
jgi:hypothetical protein